EIVLTGKLGDVMKESAKTGISYIRSIVDKFDIDPEFYKTNDIHIHIPEGAVPKDGPSAGITMALAVISALTKRPVPGNIAMTGEITLRGRVLAVGGVKEKLLAAHRAGITKVLIPKECEADLDEIPENVKEKMEFVLVEHMDEVLEQALLKSGENNEN
ncbi:endopeptidase La, partial [Clostridioides difficile]|nr:endopeptidase La [Clostridioides difficile]